MEVAFQSDSRFRHEIRTWRRAYRHPFEGDAHLTGTGKLGLGMPSMRMKRPPDVMELVLLV